MTLVIILKLNRQLNHMNSEEFKMQVLPLNTKLYYFALRYLKDSEDAKDAVQEVFVKLWVISDKLGSYSKLKSFIYTVTRNLCLDKLKAKRTYSLPETNKMEPVQSGTPAKELDDYERLQLVKNIIDGLPEQQRHVVQLRDIDECTFEEIAEILDMELNAIRVNLSRARKKIRDEVAKIYDYGI